jgi:hypothetical protein
MTYINMTGNRMNSPNYPVRGMAKRLNPDTDPLGQITAPTASVIGGLVLGGRDYTPNIPMCGFEVHGVQSEAVVMVEFDNGSTGRFDNISIESGVGWVSVEGYSIVKILKESTATGIYPMFN